MTWASWLRWTVGLAISAALVWLAYRDVPLDEMALLMVRSRRPELVLQVASTIVTMVLRGIRWRLCFEARDPISNAQSVAAYSIGSASGQVIPARLGDLVRVYVLSQATGVSKSKGIGTLVVERLSDLFAVLLILALLLPFFSLPSWIRISLGVGAGVAVAAFAAVYLLGRHSLNLSVPAWASGNRVLAGGIRLLAQLLQGFSVVNDLPRACSILLLSFCIWIVQASYYFWALEGMNLPLGWPVGALFTTVLALVTIVPAGPGFAGSFDLAAQSVLGLFNVGRTEALAYLNLTRLTTLVGIVLTALGGVALLYLGSRNTAETGALLREAGIPEGSGENR